MRISLLLVFIAIGNVHAEINELPAPSQEACQKALYRIWFSISKPYQVWNPEVSTVAIRGMVDQNSISPNAPYLRRIMMGTARIGQDLLLHQHHETEIYYILKGEGRTFLTANTREYEFKIEAGSFFYLPSGMPHYTVSNPENPIELLYVFPTGSLDDVEYVFDGSLSIPFQNPIIGKLPLSRGHTSEVIEQTLVDARDDDNLTGQVMKNLYMPAGRQRDHHIVDGDHRIIFIRQGKGFIAIDGQEFPIPTGSYLYLEGDISYSIRSMSSQDLDVLIFE